MITSVVIASLEKKFESIIPFFGIKDVGYGFTDSLVIDFTVRLQVNRITFPYHPYFLRANAYLRNGIRLSIFKITWLGFTPVLFDMISLISFQYICFILILILHIVKVRILGCTLRVTSFFFNVLASAWLSFGIPFSLDFIKNGNHFVIVFL